MIIDKALTIYRSIHRQMEQIGRLLSGQNSEAILSCYTDMTDLQKQAQELDHGVLQALRNDIDLKNDTRITELLDLMQQIQDTNHKMVPQIRGIMAVKKAELNKLSTGNTVMRRYHSKVDQTGSHLSSSG